MKHGAWTRVPGEHDTCHPSDPVHRAGPARVHSISPDGITLTLGQRVKVGTVLSLELVNKADGSRRLVVQVVHVARRTDGRWVIRCTFAEPFSKTELHSFIPA